MRTTITWQVVLVTALAITGPAVSAPVAGGGTPTPSSPLYGVTIDRITHIATVVAAEKALPERPITRVYFDVSEPASYYASAVPLFHTVSQVMGELLDSSDARSISTSAFQSRVEDYLNTLGSSVDLWEIGNEVNGNWTGPYATGATKVDEAYSDVAKTGGKTALTLYANEYGPDALRRRRRRTDPGAVLGTVRPEGCPRRASDRCLRSYYRRSAETRSPRR